MLIFGFGYVAPMLVSEVALFGCDRDVSCALALCAPASRNALGSAGSLDMGGLRNVHFRDNPKEWGLLFLRCDSPG